MFLTTGQISKNNGDSNSSTFDNFGARRLSCGINPIRWRLLSPLFRTDKTRSLSWPTIKTIRISISKTLAS